MSDPSQMSSLVWGLKNGDVEVVKQEIEKNSIDVNQPIGQGRYALHFAADFGQSAIIEFLLSKGADINKPDKHGISPLLAAIWENHPQAVKLLLEKGADKNGTSPDGMKYIECAETDEIKMMLK